MFPITIRQTFAMECISRYVESHGGFLNWGISQVTTTMVLSLSHVVPMGVQDIYGRTQAAVGTGAREEQRESLEGDRKKQDFHWEMNGTCWEELFTSCWEIHFFKNSIWNEELHSFFQTKYHFQPVFWHFCENLLDIFWKVGDGWKCMDFWVLFKPAL